MKWNPIYNAIGAAAYVWTVGIVMNYVGQTHSNVPDTFIDPIVVLSLLVFSAALMGFLFFYYPAILLIENKKKEAVDFFLKTLGVFGLLTLVAVLTVLYT
ncbi:MAG: hypothetical protein JWO50_34 [Candidatus Kaiserbacteria bacterium]|nr:hypothetical protein [Candidatus Kaiserbacteria bacterium]